MKLYSKKFYLNIFLCTVFVCLAGILFAGISHKSFAQTSQIIDAQRAKLEEELAQIEAEKALLNKQLDIVKQDSASFGRDIKILNTKIQEALLVIKQKTLAISQLGGEIDQKEQTIEELAIKIEKNKESLAELLEKTNEADSFSIAEVMLSRDNLSDFFSDLDAYDQIKKSLREAYDAVRDSKKITEEEKKILDKKLNDEADAKAVKEAEKRKVQASEAERQKLLAVSKSKEKTYGDIIKEKEAKAAQIRSALFALRDSAAIPFGDALKYATEAQAKTGVRPAFLLGILTQESKMGQNVGQCFVTNLTNGDGVGKNTGTIFKGIMKPSRDIAPFIELSKELGFDPTAQVVSCPQTGGYGGAMGPSQIIPSTWAIMKEKVSSVLGGITPNPWIARDAIFASALYLADLGAGGGTYSAESQAAARYYAGGAWKTKGQGYAKSVMGHAQNIQENMINPLQDIGA